MAKVIIFGTGVIYEKIKNLIPLDDILCFLDNSMDKQGKKIDGKEVVSPQKIVEWQYDYIVMASVYWVEMKSQLLEMGIESQKLIPYLRINSIYKGNKTIKILGKNRFEDGNVLLVTWNLQRNGGGRALLELGRAFDKKKYVVDCISNDDGPMCHEFEKEGITVFLDSDIMYSSENFIEFCLKYDIVVINTLQNYECIKILEKTNIFVLWWIHEPDIYYEKMVDLTEIRAISGNNIHCCVVSSIGEQIFNRYLPNMNSILLTPGIRDELNQKFNYVKKSRNIKIAVIGNIGHLKGHDYFLDAFLQLDAKYRNQLDISFIGRIGVSKDTKDIINRARDLSNISLVGELTNEQIHMMFSQGEIDVVIVPSEVETLSLAAVEGMMYYACVIVSNTTGISAFINNYVNGIVFNRNKIEELIFALEWVVDHPEEVKKMKLEARKLYEKSFSLDALEKNISNILNRLNAN